MNVGKAIVAELVDAGVRRCYTVPGESFLPLLDAIGGSDELRLISTRHESGASFMASAEAKLTSRPALALATRGPGACNLSIGVHTAFEDETPLLAIVGDVKSEHFYRGAFQEVDLAALYRPITKLALRANRGDRLPDLVAYGLRVATAGRPGPVMISVPEDLFDTELPVAPSAPAGSATVSAGVPAGEVLDLVARRLTTARRPVVIAGIGCRPATEELLDFAVRYDLGVYAAFRCQDVFPNDHRNYLGHLGLNAGAEILDELNRADLIVVLGSRLDEVTSQSFTIPGGAAQVIQLDREPATIALSFAPDIGLVCDVGATLRALAGRPGPRRERDWSAAHGAYLGSTRPGPDRAATGLDPAQVIGVIGEQAPAGTIVTNDAGNFAAFLHRYWRFGQPHTQLAPSNGAMGYAVPAAVGGKLGAADRDVYAFVGDGGFLMTGVEVETAVREGLSLTVFVFRNGLYGTIAMHQGVRGMSLVGTEIGQVDVAGMATSLGATGIRVDSLDGLRAALGERRGASGVTVLDLQVDPDLITPTRRLSELAPGKAARGE